MTDVAVGEPVVDQGGERPPVGRPDGPELLFEEARARRRRRWTIGAGAVLAGILIAAASAAVVTTTANRGPPPATIEHRAPPVVRTAPPAVAWVDYDGHLRVGDPTGARGRVVAAARADPTTPLVAVGRHLFWVDTGCTDAVVSSCPYSPVSGYTPSVVKELDLASGATRTLGPGQAVVVGADGSSVVVVRRKVACPGTTSGVCDPNAQEIVEVPLGRGAHPRVVAVPTGWYVNAGAGYANPIAAAGGLLVESELAQTGTRPPVLGLWHPASGRVEHLGRDWGLIDAHTAPGGRSSLLAWLPGSCESDPHCPLLITNLGTRHRLLIRSPLPYGFDVGGAFSPDGGQLAVFVKANAGAVNPAMQLAIVETRTGAIRLVPGVEGEIGESVGWARWLPDGTQVLAGTFSTDDRRSHYYLVTTRPGVIAVADVIGDRNLDANFSTTVIGQTRAGGGQPPRRAGGPVVTTRRRR